MDCTKLKPPFTVFELPFPVINGCTSLTGSRIVSVDWALLLFYNVGSNGERRHYYPSSYM